MNMNVSVYLYLPVAWFLLSFGPKMYKKTLGY